MSQIAASHNNATAYCGCPCHSIHWSVHPPICNCSCRYQEIKRFVFPKPEVFKSEMTEMAKMIEKNKEKDNVNHPKHYINDKSSCGACGSPIECIDVTRHMNFNIGNAMKYIWRHEHKNNAIEDLKKAAWYLFDEIARLEKEKK